MSERDKYDVADHEQRLTRNASHTFYIPFTPSFRNLIGLDLRANSIISL